MTKDTTSISSWPEIWHKESISFNLYFILTYRLIWISTYNKNKSKTKQSNSKKINKTISIKKIIYGWISSR